MGYDTKQEIYIRSNINYLKADITRLTTASENLTQILNVEIPTYVEDTLMDDGLIIDNEMPFQFYIEDTKLDISTCITNIENEILKIQNNIKKLEKEIVLMRTDLKNQAKVGKQKSIQAPKNIK